VTRYNDLQPPSLRRQPGRPKKKKGIERQVNYSKKMEG